MPLICLNCGYTNTEYVERCEKCSSTQFETKDRFPNTYEESDVAIPERAVFKPEDLLNSKSGKFRIIKRIGKGGFGAVYLIEDDKKKHFALKILTLWEVAPDPDEPKQLEHLKKRFEREFEAGRIPSRYLVKSYSHGIIKGNPYIIMEYCPGGSLEDNIKDFEEEKSYEDLAFSILKGLNDLHSNGFIHRDIKPENILFDQYKYPKLADFGISGHINKRLTKRNKQGESEQIWATAVYAPPEAIDLKIAFKAMNSQIDMFSFGVVMYEVISKGKYPFGGFDAFMKDPKLFYDNVRKGKYIPLESYNRNVSATWQNLIYKCIEPDWEKRLATPTQALKLLGRKGKNNPILSTVLKGNIYNNGWYLQVMNGDESNRVYALDDILNQKGKEAFLLTLGSSRSNKNDIKILEKHTNYISRTHATLEFINQQWHIKDGQKIGFEWKKSLNGIFVNSYKVKENVGYYLQDRDIVTVGDTTLKLMHKK